VDIRALAAHFYATLKNVLLALFEATELSLKFPLSDAELNTAARGFQLKITNGLLVGCVGAIDGWLCRIKVPSAIEVGKVRSFFSEHYQAYGLNIGCHFSVLETRVAEDL
jgi:hypothetical protein